MRTDLKLHYGAGATITVWAAAVLAPEIGPVLATGAGALLGCAAGLAKDFIWDLALGRGQFDPDDIGYTALGAAHAVPVALAATAIGAFLAS